MTRRNFVASATAAGTAAAVASTFAPETAQAKVIAESSSVWDL